ncbi:hypothetical protein GALL_400060 [mine drainage metagenome]|uniref:Uncharacterized protein n=1 Tax=mine drainage metagenome TaxID=410659 RepID=A0A1J5Q3M7_9ZZZZ
MEVTRTIHARSASNHRCVGWDALQKTRDSSQLIGVVERAEKHVLIWGTRERHRFRLLGKEGHKFVVDRGLNEHSGARGAVLAGVEIASDRDCRSSGFQIGIFVDDHGGVSTQFEVDSLNVLRRRCSYLHARSHRAGDRDHLRRWVLYQGAPSGSVATDDVEDASWQVFGKNLGHPHG